MASIDPRVAEVSGSHTVGWRTRSIIFVLILAVLPRGREAAGQVASPDPNRIVCGMSTALTGPTADLGLNMRAGILAAMSQINQAGGVKGRRLHLISLDDGYEPERTARNMRRLIEEDRVVALVGNVGTPTAVAAVPIATTRKTLFFGAFTGAGILRQDPPNRYVINYRASYDEETEAMIASLIAYANLRPEEIAFFTQRDAYGDAGFAGGVAALKRHGFQGDENDVALGRYERNTVAVENALADILLHPSPIKAVIMIGAYAPCAEFVRLARQNDLDVIFLSISFVGATSLAQALGPEGDGVIVTQVVPHFQADLPVVRDYRVAMRAWDSSTEFTFGSLEGYIVARIFCRALETIEWEPNTETIVEALEALGQFDMGLGTPLALGPENHQACHCIWPTVLSGGKVVPYDWERLGAAEGVEK